MSRFRSQPTLNPDVLLPNKMAFDTPGAGIDGGRNGLGEAISILLSGGPIVTGSYENCFVHDPAQHRYVNWLRARLNGGMRFINVPILNEWTGPFPVINGIPTAIVGGIPHSDGALFSDGAGYSQPTVWGKVMEAAPLHSGSLRIRVYNAPRRFDSSDWFSIEHETKGWRVYSYWDVLQTYDDGSEDFFGLSVGFQEYLVAIDVPLREAVPAGQRVELARPKCVMKFPVGFTLPWEVEGFYQSSPSIKFTEAF